MNQPLMVRNLKRGGENMGLLKWLKKLFVRKKIIEQKGRSVFTDYETWVDDSPPMVKEKVQSNLRAYGLREENQSALESWGVDFD